MWKEHFVFLPSSQLDATYMMRPGSGLLLRFSADKIRWSDNGRPRRSGLPRDMIVGIHAFSCYSYITTICVLHPRYYKPGNTTTAGLFLVICNAGNYLTLCVGGRTPTTANLRPHTRAPIGRARAYLGILNTKSYVNDIGEKAKNPPRAKR